jgi:hypothetical protein
MMRLRLRYFLIFNFQQSKEKVDSGLRIELELLRVNWEGDFTGINEFIEHFIKVRMRKVETPPHIKRSHAPF